MGCSSSCQIFEEISSALQWVATHKLGMPAVVHVLDDFLFIAPSKTMAYECLQKFLLLCQDIGIPIANEKTEGPAQVMTFLGIELDSVNMQATLPLEKVEKCMKLIEPLLDVNKVKLRDLQCLIGTTNFACSVVRPGRTFLRRLINLTIGVEKPFYHIRLTREVKADLKAWKTFLASFNGKSFFLNDFWGKPECTIATDASTTIGYGLVFGRLRAYGKWESQMSNYHITVLELYTIVLSIHLFAETLSNKVVLFLTDNEALIPIINKGTSKDSNIMKLIRLMVVQCLRSNILVKAKHISGVENTRPDCLSRLQVSVKRHHNRPTACPSACTPEASRHAGKLTDLLEGALSHNTRKVYRQAWKTWWEFMSSTFRDTSDTLELPLDPSLVALYRLLSK